MKTLICNSPRHFAYAEAVRPELSKGHALLKIRRIGICGTDLHAFEGTQPFFNYPRILGHELAAEVIAVDGRDEFKERELLTFIPYFNCGVCIACRTGKPNCCTAIRVFGVHIDGGMSEYVSVPEPALVRGDGLDADSLALVEPLAIGAHAVRRADIRPGEFVLVVGAGPIGLGIMEFARIAGGQVIAVDINDTRLAFCKDKLKVSHIIHGQKTDVAERLKEITNGDMPTVVIDATGSLKALQQQFLWMAHTGRYLMVGLQKEAISFSHPEFHKREATLMSSRNATREDFEFVIHALKTSQVDPSLYITHRVLFDDVKSNFESWLDPSNGVIKVMVEMG